MTAAARVRVCLLLSLLVGIEARRKSGKDWGKMSDKDWDRILLDILAVKKITPRGKTGGVGAVVSL